MWVEPGPERDEPLPGWSVVLFIVSFLLCIAAVFQDCTYEAHAQRRARSREMTDEIALGRICWHEEGVYVTDGCAAIHAVLLRVARIGHHTYLEAAQRYSGRVFDPDRRDERRYVAHLWPEYGIRGQGEPPHWPVQIYRRERIRGEVVVRVIPHGPWLIFRDRWRDVYAHARRIIAGEIRSPCAGIVQHWGCPDCGDRERAEERGWNRIVCDDRTNELPVPNNDFWRVPGAPP